jgi:hypothetical protein
MDLHAGPVGAIGGDDPRQQATRHRHHARQHDKTAPLLGDLANATHGDAEIIQHPLRNRGELPSGRRDLDAPCRALE